MLTPPEAEMRKCQIRLAFLRMARDHAARASDRAQMARNSISEQAKDELLLAAAKAQLDVDLAEIDLEQAGGLPDA